MLTENENFILEQLNKIHKDLEILKPQWDRMVDAVIATPFFKNLKKLKERPNKTYQLCIKINGKNVPI